MLILKRRHIYRFKPRICNISKYCWLEVLRLTKSFSSSLFLDMTDDFSPKLGLTSHIVIVAVTWYRLRYRTNQIKSLFQTLSQKLKSKGLFNKTHLLFLSALFLLLSWVSSCRLLLSIKLSQRNSPRIRYSKLAIGLAVFWIHAIVFVCSV